MVLVLMLVMFDLVFSSRLSLSYYYYYYYCNYSVSSEA
jgi:hypothetical protein